MPKMNLITMVQNILSATNDDKVNSISDTSEAEQVASIIQSCYFDLIDDVKNWPHLKTLFQPEASGDSSKPTHSS